MFWILRHFPTSWRDNSGVLHPTKSCYKSPCFWKISRSSGTWWWRSGFVFTSVVPTKVYPSHGRKNRKEPRQQNFDFIEAFKFEFIHPKNPKYVFFSDLILFSRFLMSAWFSHPLPALARQSLAMSSYPPYQYVEGNNMASELPSFFQALLQPMSYCHQATEAQCAYLTL